MSVLSSQMGVVTTRFYPKAPNGSLDLSAANVPTGRQIAFENNNGTGESGVLPALWWLGIIIILVALRLAYEYA